MWSTSGKSETLQNLLGLLLEVVWGKVRTALGGMELPVPRSRAGLSFPGTFPIPLPKPADSPVSGMSERPHVAACRGS